MIVQDEAARLRLSTTPIREALAHLSGEGLVERATSGGYIASRFDAAAVGDRYAMQAFHVRMALELITSLQGAVRPPPPTREQTTPGHAVQRLFGTLVHSAGNEVLREGFQKVGGQLDLLRRHEPRLFDDLEAEAETLYRAYERPSLEGFGEAVFNYHRRRTSAAGALVVLIVDDRLGAGEAAAR